MASAMFSALLNKSVKFTAKTLLSRSRSSLRKQANKRKSLFSTISPLGEPSISLLPVLDKWVEEGKKVSGTELQRIVKELRGSRRFTQALEVSEWMSSKGLCPNAPSDQAIQLDLIGRVRGLDFAESYFQKLSETDKTDKLYGALLNCYVREGLVDKALAQMQKMKDGGFVTTLNYNNLMCLYIRVGQHEKVPHVLSQMKEDGFSPDIFSYRICMSSYGSRSDLDSVEKVLEETESQTHISTDWFTYSLVARFYIEAGMKEKAQIYLKKAEDKLDKDALGYNHLISHYANLGNKKMMLRLWSLQKVKCSKQLNREYITILGSLVKLGELEETERLIEEWELSGNTYDFRVPNILLLGYSQKGLIEKAEMMLRSMVEKGKTPTPTSWAIVASGYVDKQNMEKAFQCIKEAIIVRAENKGWRRKVHVISSILSWVTDNKDMDELEDFVNSLKTIMSMNRDMYLSLIRVYVRFGKEVDGLLQSMKADEIELDEEMEKILSSR